jgi:polysaccharide biosynthesis/export protein
MDFPMRGACAAISRLLAALTLPGCMRTTSVAYREPSVAVEIDSYRPFFILGEVAALGQYPYVPNMSVESAVAIAGGFTPRARGDRITLTDGDGPCRMVAPLGTALGPGDTVQVGERWL